VTTNESLPNVWVSLTIMGAPFDPEYVTAQLSVEPTSHFRTGDPIVRDKGRRSRDGWRVTIGPRETIEIGTMLSELLAHMASGEQELRRVCTELGVEATLTCAVEPTSALTPAILFSPDVVRWAGDRDVTIETDIMLWREEDDDE
jgi:hypothetical protein